MNRFINYYKWLGYKDFFTLLFGLMLDVFHKRIPKKYFVIKIALNKDFFTLLFGQMLDVFHKRIPKELFTSKTVFDYIQKKKGRVIRSTDATKIEIDNLKYILRKRGSDIMVFEQLIVENGLSRVLELMRCLNQAELYVLDCGANIGLTTILLKKNFPNAKIISLEPEPQNFAQLVKNLEINNCNDVVPLQMGVWHEKTMLEPVTDFRDGESWAFSLKPGNEASCIPVNTPQAIAYLNGWNKIDVLKIDIEGSEFSLFRNLNSWVSILDTVRIISLEVHEDVGSLFEIADLLKQRGFLLEEHGELLIGIKK